MRPKVRPITASTTSETTRATSTSPSTTPMTMLTSTCAWCTPCVERARRAHSFTLDVVSHLIGSSPESSHNHLHTIHGGPSLTRFSLSTSTCSSLSFLLCSSFPSCSLSSTTRSSWHVCAFTHPRGYDLNAHDFNELWNSSVPLAFKIPAADQDEDGLTLGKMLTEAYRGQVDYFVQGGVSVSQLSSSVRSDSLAT